MKTLVTFDIFFTVHAEFCRPFVCFREQNHSRVWIVYVAQGRPSTPNHFSSSDLLLRTSDSRILPFSDHKRFILKNTPSSSPPRVPERPCRSPKLSQTNADSGRMMTTNFLPRREEKETLDFKQSSFLQEISCK